MAGKSSYSRLRARRRRRDLRRRVNLRRFVPFVLCLIVALVSIYMLADYAVESLRRRRENVQLAEEFSGAFILAEEETPLSEGYATPEPTVQATSAPTPTPKPQLKNFYRSLSGAVPQQARKLYKLNNDLVGWLYINDLVDLPVVYRDNEYYLTHGFNQAENSGGTLFLDQYHPMSDRLQNILVHGHNMYDSSMFGGVAGYTHLRNVKEYAFARFSTLYAPEDYVIFAVVRVNPDVQSPDYLNYIGTGNFADEDEFNRFVGELMNRSLFQIPVDVLPSDGLLSLSTCVDDDRLLVVYRRLRDGETREELQAQVDLAFEQ